MFASFSRLAAVLGLLVLPWRAEALEGAEWQWNAGESRRYVVRTHVVSPETLVMYAEKNIEVPVTGFTLAMIIDCTLVTPVGKKAFEVECGVEDAKLGATPIKSYRTRTLPVLDEWTTLLEEEAKVRFVQAKDGRVRAINLYGVDGRNNRTRLRAETLRQMVERAFAAFDLRLPKKGTDSGAGFWIQREGLPLRMMTDDGSLGNMNLTHKVIAEIEGDVLVAQEGSGIVTASAGTEGALGTAYKLELAGSVRYDPEGKQVVNAQFVAEGQATAGGARAEGIAGPAYEQATYLELMAPGAEAPDLGPNEEQ